RRHLTNTMTTSSTATLIVNIQQSPPRPARRRPAQPAEGELPRRRRRKPVSELDESAERTESIPPRSPEETGSRWAALQRGTESGRAAAQSEPPRSPEGNAQS
ncbi:hypothetical protein ABZS78_29620, partial [Streptomyces decoyicus]